MNNVNTPEISFQPELEQCTPPISFDVVASIARAQQIREQERQLLAEKNAS